MKDDNKTKKQLAQELTELRSQYAALKESVSGSLSAELAAEEALRNSEEQFRMMVESVKKDYAIIMLDVGGHIVSWNAGAEHIKGYAANEIIGRHFSQFYPKEDVKSGKPEWELETATTKGRFEDEGWRVRKDGSRFLANVLITPLRGDNGQLRGFAKITRDITERKQMEKELKQSEERYRSIFENAQEGILQTSVEGRFLTANRAMAIMLGYDSPEDLITTVINIPKQLYVNPEDRKVLLKMIEEQGAIRGFETQFYRKNGSMIWVSVNLQAVRDAGGHVLYYEGLSEDITFSKDSEDRIKKEAYRTKLLLELYWMAPKMADKELYDYVLEKTVNLTNSKIGFFHQVNDDGKTIILTTWNAEALKSCTADYDNHYPLEQAGNWVDCVRYKKPIIYNDFPNAPNQKGLPEGHVPIRRFMSIPVINNNNVYMIFGVGNKEEEYADNDLSQLQLVANELYKIIIARKTEGDLKDSFDRLQKALTGTVKAMATVVESRDPYTAGHQRRVVDLVRSIASEMNLPADQIEGIQMAASIHDLGKISVPAEILSKPTKLTALECGLIKTHTQSGYDILKDIDFPWPIARMVLEHHERMNGSGYPNGLTGDNILLESRIIAVADVVESMASHRPYRPSLGIEAALEEIEKNKGTFYDNNVADACLRLFRGKGYQLAGA